MNLKSIIIQFEEINTWMLLFAPSQKKKKKQTEKEMNDSNTHNMHVDGGCQCLCSLVVSTFFRYLRERIKKWKTLPLVPNRRRKNKPKNSSKTKNDQNRDNKILFRTLPKFNSIRMFPHSQSTWATENRRKKKSDWFRISCFMYKELSK